MLFSDYVTNVRLQAARELLLNTSLLVGDIAERVGFTSVSYFVQQFRKKYCMTPKKYRQTYHPNEE